MDDGVQDLDEALAAARFAVDDGIGGVVSTPHYVSGLYHNGRSRVLNAVEQFKANLDQAGIPLVIYPGAELRIEFDTARKIRLGDLLTMNDSGRYALIELPHEFAPPGTENFFYGLQVQGITPIVAHPERNPALLNDPVRLHRWIESGVLTQITAGSLLGDFGNITKMFCRFMLEHSMVHLIATDTHGIRRRTPILSRAREEACSIVGRSTADRIFLDNPQAVIRGEQLGISELLPLKTGFDSSIRRIFSSGGWA